MKRKVILVILVFLFVNDNYSQNKKESQDSLAYDKIKNWAVAKLTIAYIEDYKGWDDSKPDLKTKNEQDEWDSYKKIKNKYSKYSNNVNLDTLNNELSIAWSKTRDNVFNKYKLELIDGVTRFNFKKIAFIPSKNPNKETLPEELKKRKETIEAINEQYKNTIKAINSESITVDKNNLKNAQDRNIRRTGNSEEFSKYPLVLVLLTLSLIFNFFLIIKLRSSKKNNATPKKVSHDYFPDYQKSNEKIRKLEKENDRYVEIIKQSRGNISQIDIAESPSIKEVETKTNEKQVSISQINLENQEIQILKEEKAITIDLDVQKTKSTLLYLPAPFQDNRFASEDASEVKKPTSLYQAEVAEDSNEVYFTLMQTIDLSRALNSPNIYLETACEYENTYTTSAKAAEVVEKGVMRLEGKDWVVKKKIRIKFN